MIAAPIAHLKINAPPTPDFADPLGLIAACHKRIDRLLRSLEVACEALRDGTRDEKREAWTAIDTARAIFAGPAAKHHDDEERSLFPRLRAHAEEIGVAALEAMDELEIQHRTITHLEREFDRLAAKTPRDGTATEMQLVRLEETVVMLSSFYRPHLNIENELLLPVAANVLGANEVREIGAEMMHRRGLVLPVF